MSVLVVGGGFAGWAACWGLLRRGAEVQWLFEHSGASGLYSGALDYRPWSECGEGGTGAPTLACSGSQPWLEWLRDFEGWLRFDKQHLQWVVSGAGVVRPALVRDAAVLDLHGLIGKRLGVVDLQRPGWPAAWLARSIAESDWARQNRLEVGCLRVDHPEPAAAAHLGDADLCGTFQQSACSQALLSQLREVGSPFDAFLFGPWLGGRVAAAFSLALERPVGETLSEPGQGAGLRYDTERDQWARAAGVSVFRGRLLRLECASPVAWQAHVTSLGSTEQRPLGSFDGAVLCTGGIVGGGLEFCPEGARRQRFVPSYDAPLEVRVSDANVEWPIGQQRSDLVAMGLSALDRVGLLSPTAREPGRPPLAVAGAALAARARTALEAVESGLDAACAVS